MFSFEFMRIAFIVGILLSIIVPIIGSNVVYKHLSMSGDALSHTSLAGVTIGLVFGYNPVVTAIITSIIASLTIEFIRKKFAKYSEISIAIVMSAGIGIAGLLSSFTNTSTLNNYLFGSIVAITKSELHLTIAVTAVVLIVSVLLYKELMYIAYNEKSAKLAGVPVNIVNTIYTIITATTVALASKTIGALIVASLMVIPVATSMQISKSYKSTIFHSIIISIFSVVMGLVLSYYLALKPGATIVLINVALLIIVMIYKAIANIIIKNSVK